jgi:hypothetical protein
MAYPKELTIMRLGKTARDKAAGAPARAAQNATARGAWSRETHGGRSKGAVFPQEICNGRKSRALRAGGKRKQAQEAIQKRGK